jgi:hypothetical protein
MEAESLAKVGGLGLGEATQNDAECRDDRQMRGTDHADDSDDSTDHPEPAAAEQASNANAVSVMCVSLVERTH